MANVVETRTGELVRAKCPECGHTVDGYVHATYPTKFDDRVGLWLEPCGHDATREQVKALVGEWDQFRVT